MSPTPESTPAPLALTINPDAVVPFLSVVLLAVLVLMVSLLVARLARSATLKALQRTQSERSTALLVGRVVFISIATVGTLTAMGMLGVPWATVVALTGVLGLAASLALQDVLKNFVAGVYLLIERPFRIGESIKVREFVGRVESVDVRTTVLRTDDGEAIMVPNAILFAEIILNRGISLPDPGPRTGEGPAPL